MIQGIADILEKKGNITTLVAAAKVEMSSLAPSMKEEIKSITIAPEYLTRRNASLESACVDTFEESFPSSYDIDDPFPQIEYSHRKT